MANTVALGIGKYNADLSDLSDYDRARLKITMKEISETKMPELQAGGPSCAVLHDILWGFGFYLHVANDKEWGWSYDAINRGLKALDLFDSRAYLLED